MKALFIHGLGSDKNSSTGALVKKIFNKYGIETRIDTFDVLNPEVTINKINQIIHDDKINIIVGHSLGGFYPACCKDGPIKIFLNPCLHPTKELPKLDVKESLDAFVEYEEYSKSSIDSEDRAYNFGIFGDHDELFSYYDEFKRDYGHCMMVDATHMFTEDVLDDALNYVLDYFDIEHYRNAFKESFRLREHFTTVFVKENPSLARRYAEPVYNILEDAYRYCGGIIGVNEPEDLIRDTDIWKLNFKNGKLLAVALYTTKRGGRKVTAIGALVDPETGKASREGKDALYQIVKEDLYAPGAFGKKNREMWAEVSDSAETVYTKKFNAEILPPSVIRKLMPDKEFADEDEDDGHYKRALGGEYHRKIGVKSSGYNPTV